MERIFFQLKVASDIKKIGKVRYPQAETTGYYDWWGPNSIWKINSWQKIDFGIEFPMFLLKPSSKLTDVVSSNAYMSSSALLCSDKLKNVILDHDVPQYQLFHPVQVIQKEESYDYNFLYFYKIHNQYVDFPASRFYIEGWEPSIHPFTIKDVEEFNLILNSIRKMQLNRLLKYIEFRLLEDEIELDLFRVAGFFGCIIISEKLKESLEREKVTGIDIIPIEEVYKKKFPPNYRIE